MNETDIAMRFYLGAIETTEHDVAKAEYLLTARRILMFDHTNPRHPEYDKLLRPLETKYRALIDKL